ncbi:MAG TPA: transcription-repair coupling factor [Candidatus Hydromicrobium sp.]
MAMFLENFINEKQWQQFIEKYKKTNTEGKKGRVTSLDTLIADENIWPFIISAFLKYFDIPVLVITSTFERASELEQEISCIIPKAKIFNFPSLGNGIFYKNRITAPENLARRLNVIKNLLNVTSSGSPSLIISTSNSLLNLMPVSKFSKMESIEIQAGGEYKRDWLISGFISSGYERVHMVYDRGEFSIRGGVIDIFDITGENPVRIDFLGDEAEKIFFYDVSNNKLIKDLNKISVFPNINPWEIEETVAARSADRMISFIDLLKDNIPKFAAVLCDPVEIYLKIRSDIDILHKIFDRDKDILRTASKEIADSYLMEKDFLEREDFCLKLNIISAKEQANGKGEFDLSKIAKQKKSFGNSVDFIQNIKKDLKDNRKVIISIDGSERRKKIEELFLSNSVSYHYLKNGDKVKYNLLQSGIAGISNLRLYRGYQSRDVSLYGELDIYDRMQYQISEKKISPAVGLEYFKPGEYVVHKNHGIGKYIDIISKQVDGYKREYFLIEYANNDRLYVPTWQADRIGRYIGEKNPAITPLNSRQWDSLKRRVRKSVHKLAIDLAKLYAERDSASGYAFPADSPWQKEIEDLFPFKETPDQVRAIDYVKNAMSKSKPMDILVIGDVGFGKTEVAVRAAFKSIENGKQVLMLVPTTILADQHYQTFSKRYKNYPVNLEVLSRFRTRKKQKDIVKDFNEGKIDMIIGTHRILQEDIKPKDLGLIIIDEEQRFGVGSKEKIKLLKTEVDVLTLSATPIPRTLHMSLTGVRDIVLIETYPEGRNPIETFVGEIDDQVVRRAIERELARGGQVYYVYNRVSGIENKKIQLQQLVPQASIALTHGQMEGSRIEKIMSDFINKKYDILLTTSIIESGMDIGNVNTLIVENSQLFGLSQLYQLRGRVGRSSERAYSYFFYPGRRNLGLQAFQRLKTLTEYTDLGSGYNVAMRDLEIRGAGEILGPRQHGHINSVGFDMYCQIIKEEIEKLKGKKIEEDINVQIDLPVSAYIPKSYIESEKDRINIYKVLGNAESPGEIDEIKEKMDLRYKKAPPVVNNLVNIARIKYLLRKARIEKILFSAGKGIILKRVDMPQSKAREMNRRNSSLSYEPATKQIIIKKAGKNIDLDLVLNDLNDIISFI